MRTDERIVMTKLTAVFRNFVKAPKKCSIHCIVIVNANSCLYYKDGSFISYTDCACKWHVQYLSLSYSDMQ
jgi:hypothetical protein